MELTKLKGLLRERKKTYEDMAKFLEISIATFNAKINGERPFSCWEATKIADYLGLTEEERVSIFLR